MSLTRFRRKISPASLWPRDVKKSTAGRRSRTHGVVPDVAVSNADLFERRLVPSSRERKGYDPSNHDINPVTAEYNTKRCVKSHCHKMDYQCNRSISHSVSTSSSTSSGTMFIDDDNDDDSLCDPFDTDPLTHQSNIQSERNSTNETQNNNNGFENKYFQKEYMDSPNQGGFDIIGQTAESRFPWLHDVGIQCSILNLTKEQETGLKGKTINKCHDQSQRMFPEKKDIPIKKTEVFRCASDLGSSLHTNGKAPMCEEAHRRRRARTLTSGAKQFSLDERATSKRIDSDVAKPANFKGRRERYKPVITRTTSAGSGPSVDEAVFSLDASVDSVPSTDLGVRADTLASPRVSPLPWLQQSLPRLIVTPLHAEQGCARTIEDELQQNLLMVPHRKPIRRKSSGSLQSASDDSDTESPPALPPATRRGRRQAICDPKSMADGDISPTNSCDESESSGSGTTDISRKGRKRSSGDLGMNYPGDLLVHGRQKKVLLKRNTIADFANTKAYQASTASLISELDSKKKPSSFWPLKLIDKKSHRAKETVSSLGEILAHLKPSEFKDTNLSCYKDSHWSELIASRDEDHGFLSMSEHERKRREAVWELFKSECVFLIDHLMVLKHCFMEPLKKVQVENYLMFTEPQELFGNLDELCYVSYTFCKDFINVLLKDASSTDFGRTEVLVMALQRFSQLTRDGEVYHEYCLNYSKAVGYLEQLRRNEDFTEFEKWCEHDDRCHRLQLTDLLISPMQHCTKVPLLLANIRKYTDDPVEQQQLTEALEKLESSLKNLETKMKWLKNFERVQEIQQQILWQPITELEPRAFIPEFLKATLNKQPCEKLLASPKRQLLHEGPLTLLEINKTVDMYMLLFDDILLLTRVKKPPRKKSTVVQDNNPIGGSAHVQTDGAVFVVHRQPIALDRFTIHDVRPPDAAASGLKNAFVLVQISRFQQIIGVYTLQAPTEAAKAVWLAKLHDAQKQYKAAVQTTDSNSSTSVSFETNLTIPEDMNEESLSNNKARAPRLKDSKLQRFDDASCNISPEKDTEDCQKENIDMLSINNSSFTLTKSLTELNIDDSSSITSTSSIALRDDVQTLPNLNTHGVTNGLVSSDKPMDCNQSEDSRQEEHSTPPRLPPQTTRHPATMSRMQRLNLLKVIHEKSKSTDSIDMLDPVYI